MIIRNRLILLLATIFLCSCAITKSMWQQGYEDRIKNFFVSSDAKHIVFIGGKYHYVLVDDSNILKDILSWSGRSVIIINAKKTALEVDGQNNLNGEVFLETVSMHFPKEYWAFLQGIGFKEDRKNGVFSLKIKVKGQRYLPRFEEDLSKANLPSLTIPYKIFVREKPGALKTACLAALTPITLTLDGMLLIGKVVLKPFGGN